MAKDFTNYTVNMPHQAAWLVYINGIEIPVVSVDVDFGVWMIPEVRITMVPHVILQRIGYEDRLQVSVWYLDEWFAPDNPEFKIMGEFECTGWSYTNSGQSRFIQLNCRAQTQIMEQLHFYYMSAVDDMVTSLSPATGQNPNMYSQSMVYYPASLFLHGMVKKTVESVAAPAPAPAPAAAASTGGASIGGSGAAATGTPKDSATTSTSTVAEATTTTSATDALAAIPANVVAPEDFVRSPFEFISNIFKALLSEIDTDNSSPSKAAPGKIPADAASVPGRNFFARWMNFTDFRRRWAGLPFFDSPDAQTMDGCFPLIKAVQATEVLSALQQQLGQSIGQAGSMWELLKSIYTTMYMEIVTIPAPPAVSIQKGTGLLKGPIRRKKGGTVIRNGTSEFGGILHHIVKPQCIFGLPPTCNIIFPSMIKSYTFQEDYMSQPTRMYLGEKYMSNILNAGATGSPQALVGELLTTGYPPVVRERMQQYIADPKQNTKNFLVYPEELYKGPVTAQKNAPPWLWMLEQKHKAQVTAGATYTTGEWFSMSRRKVKEAIKPLVASLAGKVGIPVAHVFTVISIESGFVVNDTSKTGAQGLMQLQPFVAEVKNAAGKVIVTGRVSTIDSTYNLARKYFGWQGQPRSAINAYDPPTALKLGIAYIKFAVDCETKANGKKPNLNNPNDPGTRRVIGSYLIGATKRSPIWKLKFKPNGKAYFDPADKVKSTNNYMIENTDTRMANYTKRWEKYKDADLAPKATTASTASNPAQVEPEGEDAEPQTTEATPAEAALKAAYVPADRGSALGRLFSLYARYEYYRARFESRSGGVVMPLNPYIVPGFSAVIFDEKTSGFDTFGYVTKVSHSMSVMGGSPSMMTTVNFAFARSFSEFIKQVHSGVEEADAGTDMLNFDCAPSEPIPSVGEVFQTLTKASSLYRDLFYPGTTKETVFDWENSVDVCDLDGKALNLVGDGYVFEEGLVIKPNYRYLDEFRAADAAMFYIARPVCTLRDYIELRHGRSIKALTKEGNVVKGMDKSYYHELKSGRKGPLKGGATFWGRIDAYVQGPGRPDSETIQRVTNMGTSPDYTPNPDGSWDIITAIKGIPQTRKNWDRALRRYRAIVRGEGRHAAPQL